MTAFLSHHPSVIIKRIKMQHEIQERILSSTATSKGPKASSSPTKANRVAPSPSTPEEGQREGGGEGGSQTSEGKEAGKGINRVGRDTRNTVTLNVDATLKDIGVEVAAREVGEDLSFFVAAIFALPFSQETWCYTIIDATTASSYSDDTTTSRPSTADVLVCLFCFSLTIEHILSVMGIMAIERKGILVTHKYSTVSLRVITGTAFLCMLLAAGES